MKLLRPSYIPAIALFLLSLFLLTLPGSHIPSNDWFGKVQMDKWVHIFLFSILTTLCCWGSLRKSSDDLIRRFLIFSLACLAYGIIMEFVQKYCIVNRSFDLYDIFSDAIGTAIGFFYSKRKWAKK